MSKPKSVVLSSMLIAILGVFPLMNALGNPHFAAARGLDFLQLIAVGFCFGVPFGMLMVTFVRRRRSDAT